MSVCVYVAIWGEDSHCAVALISVNFLPVLLDKYDRYDSKDKLVGSPHTCILSAVAGGLGEVNDVLITVQCQSL